MVATDGETGRVKDKQKQLYVKFGKSVVDAPNVGGVSVRNRNGVPSRKGCVVNLKTKATNK